MSITPFSGITPGSALRRTSRNYFREGVVHATTDPVKSGKVATTLCGRTVEALSVWAPGAWRGMVAEDARIGATHVTYVCRRCCAKSRAADPLNYADQTGPVLRVGVLLDDEAEAIKFAEDYAGTLHSRTDRQPDGWEVVFETGDLA